MGINAQFVQNHKLTLRTLAVKELLEHHTSISLLEDIKSILTSFAIDIDKIYSFTSDNAFNMIKLCRLIKESQEDKQKRDNEVEKSTETETELYCENNFRKPEEEEMNVNIDIQEENDDESINLRFNDDMLEDYEDMNRNNIAVEENRKDLYTEKEIAALLDDCELHTTELTVKGIRCAAHTLQLAVNDSISNYKTFIDKARKAAVQFRVESVLRKVRSIAQTSGMTKNIPKPILDVETRWHSTIDMLMVLLVFRAYGYPIKKYNLPDFEWDQVELYVKSLMPAKVATKLLQEEALLMSDLYLIWEKCKIDTQKINSSLAETIYTNLVCRESSVIGNEIVLTAMYLDPRLSILLDNEAEEKAAHHLQVLRNRLVSEKGDEEKENNHNTPNEKSNETDNSAAAEIARRVAQKCREKKDLSSNRAQTDDLRLQLKNFQEQKPQPGHCNVLAYW